MNNKNIITLLLVLITFFSCSINISFQGLTSYYNKTKSESPNLLIKLKDSATLCDTEYTDSIKIIVTDGRRLRNCIKQYDNLIIYFWSPRCKSKSCLSLESIQNYCYENGIELFIVAEYYDSNYMRINYNLKRPILGIDTKYYRTNLTSKYLKLFIYDLTSTKDIYEDYLYFNNGKYIKSSSAFINN